MVDTVQQTSPHWFLADNPLLQGIPDISLDQLADRLAFS
jgi:hypothetical protein